MDQSSPRLKVVARQARLSPRVVSYCLEMGLIQEPIDEEGLVELRRVRRLQSLGVNLAGLEIILRMRQRVLAMQAEMEALAAEISTMQAQFERDLSDLERHLARDGQR